MKLLWCGGESSAAAAAAGVVCCGAEEGGGGAAVANRSKGVLITPPDLVRGRTPLWTGQKNAILRAVIITSVRRWPVHQPRPQHEHLLLLLRRGFSLYLQLQRSFSHSFRALFRTPYT